MARGPGKLHKIIKPNGDHFWNGFRTIEELAGSLEPQIGDWQTALIYNN